MAYSRLWPSDAQDLACKVLACRRRSRQTAFHVGLPTSGEVQGLVPCDGHSCLVLQALRSESKQVRSWRWESIVQSWNTRFSTCPSRLGPRESATLGCVYDCGSTVNNQALTFLESCTTSTWKHGKWCSHCNDSPLACFMWKLSPQILHISQVYREESKQAVFLLSCSSMLTQMMYVAQPLMQIWTQNSHTRTRTELGAPV